MEAISKSSRRNSIQEWADPFFATEYFRDQRDCFSSVDDLQRLSSNFDRIHFKLDSHKKDSNFLLNQFELEVENVPRFDAFSESFQTETDSCESSKGMEIETEKEDLISEYQRRYQELKSQYRAIFLMEPVDLESFNKNREFLGYKQSSNTIQEKRCKRKFSQASPIMNQLKSKAHRRFSTRALPSRE
jgi:hypothetical protein